MSLVEDLRAFTEKFNEEEKPLKVAEAAYHQHLEDIKSAAELTIKEHNENFKATWANELFDLKLFIDALSKERWFENILKGSSFNSEREKLVVNIVEYEAVRIEYELKSKHKALTPENAFEIKYVVYDLNKPYRDFHVFKDDLIKLRVDIGIFYSHGNVSMRSGIRDYYAYDINGNFYEVEYVAGNNYPFRKCKLIESPTKHLAKKIIALLPTEKRQVFLDFIKRLDKGEPKFNGQEIGCTPQ